jgi:FkbM family methyltransferase
MFAASDRFSPTVGALHWLATFTAPRIRVILALHTFANGIRVHAGHLIQVQIDRYAAGVNLHEPVEENWIGKLMGVGSAPAGVFVDVGAAIGYYCFLMHQLKPGFELHAYEPDVQNRARLVENLELNGTPTVHLHELGVAAQTGSASLMGDGFGACVVPGRGGKQVQTTTVDAIVAALGKTVDLLKMDIQGGEGPALLGATQVLRDRSVRNWVIGTHSPELHEFCIETMRHFNHRIIFESQDVEHQPDGLVVAATGRR